MTNVIMILLTSGLVLLHTQVPALEYLRKNYEKAIDDKKLCESLIEELGKSTESNTHLAYLGAFQTIWANHVFNPLDKLATFNKGKNNIDRAIKTDPFNVEVVFIRHSVQKNSPGFLGYKDNIKEDRAFLQEHLNSIDSSVLKKMVETLLKSG